MAPDPAGQPYPRTTIYVPIPIPGGSATAITRGWHEQDQELRERCQLCPECHARDSICQVVAGETVQSFQAPLYSLKEFVERTGARPFVDHNLRLFMPDPECHVGTTAFVPRLHCQTEESKIIGDEKADRV